MVEIFKTNIDNPELAKKLTLDLLARFPGYRINFDLYDCDNILRIESHSVCIDKVVEAMTSRGYYCFPIE